jgi:quercetin dioxygenase-like cupin family protein
MKDYQLIADLREALTTVPVDSIVSRTLSQTLTLRVILFGFAAGQELSEHSTPMSATLQFLAGQATVTLGEDQFVVGPGAWVQMPPKLPHSIRAHEEPVLMLLTMTKA